ncbi:hypothetical protein RV18_GL002902 [Enterococcus termitis]|nr:hypothetical protein RV18_GL002902 [Enterococcus termitis]
MNLKEKKISYNWKTIYVGIIQNFFEPQVISDYAIELMELGKDDDFISELAWGVKSDNLQQVLFEIKSRYFPNLEEDDDDYKIEELKLRFVYLSKLADTISDDDDLLNKIAEFYNNNGYPEDMAEFINYMPQEVPTTKKGLIDRFHRFLDSENNKINEN